MALTRRLSWPATGLGCRASGTGGNGSAWWSAPDRDEVGSLLARRPPFVGMAGASRNLPHPETGRHFQAKRCASYAGTG
jgi:hypothetical protein